MVVDLHPEQKLRNGKAIANSLNALDSSGTLECLHRKEEIPFG
jgi:hypothetical protein